MKYLKKKNLPERDALKALFNHVAALFLFSSMIVIELATPATTVSPLVSMICFALFAYRMRPASVAGWVVIFSLTSLFFLLQPEQPGTPIDRATAYIRFGTTIVGGIVAVALSFDKNRITEGLRQTMSILENLPTPVIISDCEGCVVFMNNDALKLLDTTAEAVRGASYFSFVAGAQKGNTIKKYFDFVESKQTIRHDVILQITKPKPMETRASLVAITGKQGKLVATVLSGTHDLPTDNRATTPES